MCHRHATLPFVFSPEPPLSWPTSRVSGERLPPLCEPAGRQEAAAVTNLCKGEGGLRTTASRPGRDVCSDHIVLRARGGGREVGRGGGGWTRMRMREGERGGEREFRLFYECFGDLGA